jgi:hypothetical protein
MKMLHRQRGVTLIMALVMLVVLTLLALTSFNLGKSNLLIVSNMQQRDETIAAAREVIEETISSTRFFETPANLLLQPCGEANTRCIDTNGDDTPDVTVVLTPPPSCVQAQTIRVSELAVEVEDDLACTVTDPDEQRGQEGVVRGNSLCANTVWEVHAVATDDVTQASVEVTQGIAVRIPKDKLDTNCP